MSFNKVIFVGRLTGDPEIRFSGDGNTKISRFNLAIDREFKKDGEPDADFFGVTGFGKVADFIEKYLKKGMQILLDGRIQNETYTNKDGQKITIAKVYAEKIKFMEPKKEPEKPEKKWADIPDDGEELPFKF